VREAVAVVGDGARRHRASLPPADFEADPELVSRGEPLFFHHCARCHSFRGSKGAYPNLWNMAPETHAAFMAILMDGAYSYAGMAPFADVLSPEDAEAVYQYIVADQIEYRKEGTEGDPNKREFGVLEEGNQGQ